MENNKEKFHLRLNLFDGIVLVLAVLVAGFLIWNHMKPSNPAEDPSMTELEYTVIFQRWPEGDSQRIHVGDALQDNVKNAELGEVVSVQAVPAKAEILDQENGRYVKAEVPGYEDVYVTIRTACTEEEYGFMLEGGLPIRVGAALTVRGAGYMANGPVFSVERVEEAA